MKKWIFAAAVLTTATAAVAGSVSNQQVSIYTDGNGLLNASGTVRAVRNSADTAQYIGCVTYAYDTGSYSALCYAYSASGQYASCTTTDPNMMKAASLMNPMSHLYFVVNANGSCNRVIVTNTSFNL